MGLRISRHRAQPTGRRTGPTVRSASLLEQRGFEPPVLFDLSPFTAGLIAWGVMGLREEKMPLNACALYTGTVVKLPLRCCREGRVLVPSETGILELEGRKAVERAPGGRGTERRAADDRRLVGRVFEGCYWSEAGSGGSCRFRWDPRRAPATSQCEPPVRIGEVREAMPLLEWSSRLDQSGHRPPARALPKYDSASVLASRARSTVASASVAVGTALASGPPHRAVQAELLHTVLTSDESVKSLLGPRM
jgi:hypothetical protein